MTLEQLYGIEGRKLAAVMRQLLPFVAMTRGTATNQARAILTKSADIAAFRLARGSNAWVNGPTLSQAVIKGQVEAATQVGIQFGGLNVRLLARLTNEVQADLLRVSASVPNMMQKSLMKSQALVVDKNFEIIPADGRLTESLIRSTLDGAAPREMSKRILNDLGLDKGSRILLLNGQSWDAEVYSRLVSRTRTMEALNEAKGEEYKAAGFEYIETSEHDVKDDTDICAFLQGKVWALGPNDVGIPMLPEEYGLPPWHPNCSHTFGAFIPKFNGGDAALERAAKEHKNDAKALEEFQGTDGVSRAFR